MNRGRLSQQLASLNPRILCVVLMHFAFAHCVRCTISTIHSRITCSYSHCNLVTFLVNFYIILFCKKSEDRLNEYVDILASSESRFLSPPSVTISGDLLKPVDGTVEQAANNGDRLFPTPRQQVNVGNMFIEYLSLTRIHVHYMRFTSEQRPTTPATRVIQKND